MKSEQKSLQIAFILAHPDDEAIPFGLPAELTNRGQDVHLVALTDGSLGSHTIRSRRKVAALRKKEFQAAGHALKTKSTTILGFLDGRLDSTSRRQKMRLLRELRAINPDIIIIPNANDYHNDHTQTHELAKWATFHLPDGPMKTRRFLSSIPSTQKQVAVYEMDTQGSQVWKSTAQDTGDNVDNLSPVNMIVPVSHGAIETSMQAFLKHESQLGARPDGQISYPELARRGAIRRGRQAGLQYGAGLTFIPFGGYAFSTNNILRELLSSKR